MLANRVKETTATTGTGSFTTSGAVAGFQTFNTAFGTDRRFTYWAVNDTDNEWETGIGYLSASTTLVRETVLDNHLGTTAIVNFTTAPSLFHSISEEGLWQYPPREIAANNQLISAHIINPDTIFTAVATRAIFYPFIIDHAVEVDGIGLYVQTANGLGTDHLLVALYETTGKNYPGVLIGEASLDPSVTGFQSGSFTARKLNPGVYWVGFWTDVTPDIRSYTVDACLDVHLGYEAGMVHKMGFRVVLTGITVMPDPATTGMTIAQASTTPTIFLEEV
jgi:hypothetical protein